ncbi:MAG: lysylphosphatidylglycerol synthase transmembrane domain-containing protein [Planctomycetota bacterium]|jgi:uncharacterized protein (TIRG00374 family)
MLKEVDTAEAPPSPSAVAPRVLRVLLRVGISVGLLALLLRKIAPAELGEAFARAGSNWPQLLGAYSLPIFGILCAALRWQKLMEVQGAQMPLRRYCAAILVGNCFNQVLPSTIGGDVARSVWLTRPGDSAVVNLAVVTLDRAVGVFVLCLLALGCALASPAVNALLPTAWLIPALLVVGAVVGWLVLLRHGGTIGSRIFDLQPLHRYREKARTVLRALHAYRGRIRALVAAAGLSLGLQILIVAQFVLFADALGAEVVQWQFALIVPVVTVITLVPVTINGLGLREGAFAVLGAPIGLAATDAVALGWLFVAGTIGYGIIGGLIHLCGAAGRRKAR